MATIRTFTQVKPPARADGVAFTSVVISESTHANGPWMDIATIPIANMIPSAVDTNPLAPSARTFTTATAAISGDGFYRLTWKDGNSGQFVTQAIEFSDPTLTTLENLVRSEMPVFWDTLIGHNGPGSIGLSGLRSRINQVVLATLPTAVANQDASTWVPVLQIYIAKKCALDLVPTAMEYWMRQKTSSSATGTNETISYPDPIATLREIAKRLVVDIEQLAGNSDIADSLGSLGEAPGLSDEADGTFVTPSPFLFDPAFSEGTAFGDNATSDS